MMFEQLEFCFITVFSTKAIEDGYDFPTKNNFSQMTKV